MTPPPPPPPPIYCPAPPPPPATTKTSKVLFGEIPILLTTKFVLPTVVNVCNL